MTIAAHTMNMHTYGNIFTKLFSCFCRNITQNLCMFGHYMPLLPMTACMTKRKYFACFQQGFGIYGVGIGPEKAIEHARVHAGGIDEVYTDTLKVSSEAFYCLPCSTALYKQVYNEGDIARFTVYNDVVYTIEEGEKFDRFI